MASVCFLVQLDFVGYTSHDESKPWKLEFCFDEVEELASHLHLGFHHVVRSANGLVDAAAKQRVIRSSPWDVSLCNCAVGYKTLVPRLFLSGCL